MLDMKQRMAEFAEEEGDPLFCVEPAHWDLIVGAVCTVLFLTLVALVWAGVI